VIPIGLEYLTTALENRNHFVKILDLCFASSPEEELYQELNENTYDLVGFTIRNIDSAIYFNNEFFLDDIKVLIDIVKKYNIPVILGGSGFSGMPQEILDYLQADYGIIGPGDVSFLNFIESFKDRKVTHKIYDGWEAGINKNLVHIRGKKVDYPKYLSDEGIIGFETHVGCSNKCPYCIEANTRINFKEISNIVEELKYLVDLGYNHFHTCDTEFNINLNFSIEFCKALIKENLDMKWALYMKPSPYNEELFKVLHDSNANLITLSVDSDQSIQKLNNYSYRDLRSIIRYCDEYDIDLAIDLLVGYPHESLKSIKTCLEVFEDHPPKKGVGISFYYRIYKYTALAELIEKDKKLQENLITSYPNNQNFLFPVFYNQIKQETIEELIAGKDLFRIAGLIPGVNYQL
jgi:radical SAM superfamily enzyme YgiQ (UPF0313 family)